MNENMAGRVVLAMSGGVDSSVAAYLLKEQGHEVIGLFMRTGAHAEDDHRSKTCCSANDAEDARRVADSLDIPFYALDFEREFDQIKERFVEDYLAGRTPNPCVLCNIWLKFGKLWAYGKQVGADHVATGHYARIVRDDDGRARVARSMDASKDQSYVLFGLRQELLPKVLFPVGEFPKSEIRALAKRLDLPVHDKPDSQEICFVPNDDYLDFVRKARPETDNSGEIVDEEGRVLARHSGIEGFTIGQRRGLGFAAGEPRYVVQIEPISKIVRVGSRSSLDKPGLIAKDFNWQVAPSESPIRCLAQIRSRHRAVPAIVEAVANSQAIVRFDEPQSAVTPGQVVTVYEGDVVLGGGWIDRALYKEETA